MNRLLNSSILVAAGICANVLLLMLTNPSILRLTLALPLVLLLPGYAVTLILFPRNTQDIPERLLLSIGLSVVVTLLSGFMLHWTGWGLRTTSLLVVLLLWVTVVTSVVILVRRQSWADAITVPVRPDVNWRQWLLLLLAALAAVTAIHLARTPAPQQGLEGYTLLWIQPAGAPGRVHLGVSSEEFATAKYRLQFDFGDAVREGPTFELEPGETWEGFLRFPIDPFEDEPLTVFLYRLDEPTEVYRRVVWWPKKS